MTRFEKSPPRERGLTKGDIIELNRSELTNQFSVSVRRHKIYLEDKYLVIQTYKCFVAGFYPVKLCP